MMKKQIAAAVLAVSVAGGVGTGVLANALTTNDPATASPASSSATPSTPPTTPATDQVGDGGVGTPDDLVLSPGAVGPVKVGMSKADALATGYFVADVKAPVEGCPDLPLVWKDAYVDAYDVQTLGNGEITSIGIRGDGVKTAKGIGVGSSLDEVRAQYPGEDVSETGYGQSGLRYFDAQDGGWIGFLFNEAPKTVTGTDQVTFVEVTKGSAPSLMRDGC